MEPLSLALLQKDHRVARFLSGQLCHHFHAIHIVRSAAELSDCVIRFRPDVVVVDMEAATLADVEQLHREFSNLCIVCTHRIADEEMWTAAMEAGADDICFANDTRSIIIAATRSVPMAQSAAA